jgi:hypothetical protein
MADMLKPSRPPGIEPQRQREGKKVGLFVFQSIPSFCPTVLTKNAPDEAGALEV